MTREEAIKIIDCYDIGFYDLSGEKIPANKLAEAFDMAIEALSVDRPTDWTPLRFEDEYKMTSDFPWELDGSWVIVTDGQRVSVERIKKDAYDHFFPNGRYFELEDTIAWMPLPKRINNITESPNDAIKTNDEVIERPTEDYFDLPDIPRAYYEKIVGNMSHEINMLKQQLEDRPIHDCTNLVQWLLEEAMDEESWRENADANGEIICRKLKKLGVLDTKDGYYIRTPLAYDDRPSGEWEYCGSPFSKDDIINTMVCTNCGMRIVDVKGETFNYCPSCGAYMAHKEDKR